MLVWRKMKVGDLVMVKNSMQMIGIITKIDRSPWSEDPRAWVKLTGRGMEPFPFLQNQIKVLNEGR
tara:strand:+ start:652 stop:849 length:198 start_codon:yes stop_codon:yes gene_type:complete